MSTSWSAGYVTDIDNLQMAHVAHGSLERWVLCRDSWCGGGTGCKALVAVCQPWPTVTPHLQVVGAVSRDVDGDGARAEWGVSGALDVRYLAFTSERGGTKAHSCGGVVCAIAQQHEVIRESVDTRDGRRWVNERAGYSVDARRVCDLLDSSQKTNGGFECRHAKF